MRIPCEGYQIRLVWVDIKTGSYIPQQRRAYACELTWEGHPSWSLDEVAHLIDHCEETACRCKLHQDPSPFSAFPKDEERTAVRLDRENIKEHSPDTWLSSEQANLTTIV